MKTLLLVLCLTISATFFSVSEVKAEDSCSMCYQQLMECQQQIQLNFSCTCKVFFNGEKEPTMVTTEFGTLAQINKICEKRLEFYNNPYYYWKLTECKKM